MAWMSRALAQLEFLTCKTRKGPAGTDVQRALSVSVSARPRAFRPSP